MNTKVTSPLSARLSVGARMLADARFFMGYSRWDENSGHYETWADSVSRVMGMHREKYADKLTPELVALMDEAAAAYGNQDILGAQRALQFGGAQLRKHEARMYNCASSYVDRAEFFQECMYLLLCGCGVGFSVQRHHVAHLPMLVKRTGTSAKVFQIPDSIEGWADAFGVLLSSYFEDNSPFPEYKGHPVLFDFSQIRPKGAKISGGFKAPGPDGLREALLKCEQLIERTLNGADSAAMRSIVAYDFVMFMSDAVLSGGVRRSATICLFDKDDEEMLTAKTGNWFETNPQRGRSNNSAVLVRQELTRAEWAKIMANVRDFGEPGFIFTDSKEFTYNPCVEIGKMPRTEDGRSGFQFCNLVEINGLRAVNAETFFKQCRAAAIMATLQAGYTDFKYVSSATREITEREALIGVSITGWMNNPEVLFDPETLKEGAEIVKATNKMVAKLIDINPSARSTCAKPAGNASAILGSASGVHGEHSPRYFRNVQMNKDDEVAKLIMAINPSMVEESVWSNNKTDIVVSFPVETKSGSKYKRDLYGVKQLEYVKIAQQYWVEHGTDESLCTDKRLRHNVSNTISVDNWGEVEEYLYQNRQWFAGVSLLSATGDRDYAQAPFTEVLTADEVLEQYGEASLFASGLIVDGLHAFDDLWSACRTAMGFGLALSDDDSNHLLMRDWVRRFKKFAANYFGGDLQRTSYCLKDVYNLHKWTRLTRQMHVIDFADALAKRADVDASTLGAQACAGGVCEVNFG